MRGSIWPSFARRLPGKIWPNRAAHFSFCPEAARQNLAKSSRAFLITFDERDLAKFCPRDCPAKSGQSVRAEKCAARFGQILPGSLPSSPIIPHHLHHPPSSSSSPVISPIPSHPSSSLMMCYHPSSWSIIFIIFIIFINHLLHLPSSPGIISHHLRASSPIISERHLPSSRSIIFHHLGASSSIISEHHLPSSSV